DPGATARAEAIGEHVPRAPLRRHVARGRPDQLPVAASPLALGGGQAGLVAVEVDLVGVDPDQQLRADVARLHLDGQERDRRRRSRQRAGQRADLLDRLHASGGGERRGGVSGDGESGGGGGVSGDGESGGGGGVSGDGESGGGGGVSGGGSSLSAWKAIWTGLWRRIAAMCAALNAHVGAAGRAAAGSRRSPSFTRAPGSVR